jgi:hypothetical protein
MKPASELLAGLLKDATEKYGLIIEKKADKWYWRTLGVLVSLLTFGKVDFMHRFFSTIVNRIGVPPRWDTMPPEAKYEILLHEVEHMKQYTAVGFGNIWIGTIIAGIGYLFLPLPVGFAWVRAKMEMGGYAQSIRAKIQVYGLAEAIAAKPGIIAHFTSIDYLFMWPFKRHLSRWYDETVARIAIEEGAQ